MGVSVFRPIRAYDHGSLAWNRDSQPRDALDLCRMRRVDLPRLGPSRSYNFRLDLWFRLLVESELFMEHVARRFG